MARRRSIYDASYQTPLADFLEQIPDYFLKWEALKQGEAERKEAKAFRDKQYSDAVEQQRKNNEYRNEQARVKKINDEFDDDFKMMNSLDTPASKEQYFQHMIANNPRYVDKDLTSFSQALNTASTTSDNLSVLLSRRDEYNRTGTLSLYDDYPDIVDLANDLEAMRGKVGSKNKASLNKAISDVGLITKTLETTSGREMAVNDMPPTQKTLFNKLNDSFGIAQKSYMESELAMAEIGELQEVIVDGKRVEKWVPLPLTQKEVTVAEKRNFAQKERAFRLAVNKRNRLESDLKKFTKDNNLFYPEITTKQKQEELDVQSEARTSWFNENEKYINTNPELAELALQYIGDPTNADRFSALQEATGQHEVFDKYEAEVEAELELALADKDETKVVEDKDTIEPYEIGAKEPATEFEPGADITSEDVDAVLADVRETTGFYPEGDAPPIEPESEPTTKKIPDAELPPVLEPLSARADKVTEERIARQEKKVGEAELFPKVVEVKSLRESNIKDVKGNQVKFESPFEFDKQINSMYEEIRTMDKKIANYIQYGMTTKELKEMKASQKRIAEDLIKTFGVMNISRKAPVRDRNLRSTMSAFIDKKKFRDAEQFIDFLKRY